MISRSRLQTPGQRSMAAAWRAMFCGAGASPQDVMTLVMMTQYFDTLSNIGARDKSSVILLPHSPGALGDFGRQIRDATLTGELLATKATAGDGEQQQ
jgi:hypothetical protein